MSTVVFTTDFFTEHSLVRRGRSMSKVELDPARVLNISVLA